MRNINRGTAAIVVFVMLSAVPAAGAPRFFGPGGLLQTIRRFVVRAASRISPPVGAPVATPETNPDTTTTSTDTQTRTQQ